MPLVLQVNPLPDLGLRWLNVAAKRNCKQAQELENKLAKVEKEYKEMFGENEHWRGKDKEKKG